MKTILAIVALSTSVGVTAYHVTENGNSPPDTTFAEKPQSIPSDNDAWTQPRFRAPIPLNIVTPARIENDASEFEWYQDAIDTVEAFVVQIKSLQPSVTPESEEPCVALKPSMPIPVQVAVLQRSKRTLDTVEAIPVASETVADVPSVTDVVQSSPAPSSAMPMGRASGRPRHASLDASSEVERHLRPGPKWRR